MEKLKTIWSKLISLEPSKPVEKKQNCLRHVNGCYNCIFCVQFVGNGQYNCAFKCTMMPVTLNTWCSEHKTYGQK